MYVKITFVLVITLFAVGCGVSETRKPSGSVVAIGQDVNDAKVVLQHFGFDVDNEAVFARIAPSGDQDEFCFYLEEGGMLADRKVIAFVQYSKTTNDITGISLMTIPLPDPGRVAHEHSDASEIEFHGWGRYSTVLQ